MYLADKALVFAMPEMFRENLIHKHFNVYDRKAISVWVPGYYGCVFWQLDQNIDTASIEYVLRTKVAMGWYIWLWVG